MSTTTTITHPDGTTVVTKAVGPAGAAAVRVSPPPAHPNSAEFG